MAALNESYRIALAHAQRPKACAACGGRGKQVMRYGVNQLLVMCTACGGRGKR